MKRTKQHSSINPAPFGNDASNSRKRLMGESSLDVAGPDTSDAKTNAGLQLDINRAMLSRQHVRALNFQFASWVQTQVKDHPDELWEDGVRDYLSHTRDIMEKFRDVISWLEANSREGNVNDRQVNAETGSGDEVPKDEGGHNVSAKSANSIFGWSSSPFSTNKKSGLLASANTSSLFSSSTLGPGLFSSSQNSLQNTSSPSFGLLANQATVSLPNSRTTGLFSSNQNSGFPSSNQSLGGFFTTQGSGSAFGIQNSGSLPNIQTSTSSALFGQNSTRTETNTQNDANDDDEPPEPSSPSVKKTEEKGIAVVHEVKCKLYVKSSDAWKEKGTGQLLIKCKEGMEKGTKESKPTIVVRNEVGKVLLNALLYPGIKTSAQKNSLVAIFHTAESEGGDAVSRTYLIRTKTADQRSELEAVITQCAPSS